MNTEAWQSSKSRIAEAEISQFAAYMAIWSSRAVSDSNDLAALALEAPEAFWSALWDHFGVIGEKGELVCTVLFPSMPLGFWGDEDGSRCHSAYFERFPGFWCQGDFAQRRETGGFVIHGRSDATLNPGGVRIGTAEIYAEVEKFPQVKEAVVIGQDIGDDVRVVLFVTLAPGAELTETLGKEIKTAIRQGSSPRHVPAVTVPVADIPRTKSGKISELAVRDVVHGRAVKNTDSLANPEALDCFRDLPALRL